MSLKKILEQELVWASPNTPVRDIAELMQTNNVGSVVICGENGKPIGIVTDRDLVVRGILKGMDCNRTPVKEVMTRKIITLPSECGIYDVVHAMKINEIRRIPVVDEAGMCVGLLSFGDVFNLIGKEMNELVESTALKKPKLAKVA